MAGPFGWGWDTDGDAGAITHICSHTLRSEGQAGVPPLEETQRGEQRRKRVRSPGHTHRQGLAFLLVKNIYGVAK